MAPERAQEQHFAESAETAKSADLVVNGALGPSAVPTAGNAAVARRLAESRIAMRGRSIAGSGLSGRRPVGRSGHAAAIKRALADPSSSPRPRAPARGALDRRELDAAGLIEAAGSAQLAAAVAGRARVRQRELQRTAGVLPWVGEAAAVVGGGVLAGAAGIAAAGAGAAAFFWAKDADLKPDEERRLLEQDQEIALQRAGDQIRSNTTQLIIHLARILGSDVAGMPPDHQEDPERDRPHWWTEVLNFLKEITKHGLSPKQLGRELSKKFTREQIDAIIAALKKAAEMLGKDPPNFPPTAFP